MIQKRTAVNDVDNAPDTLSVTGTSSNTALVAPDGITLAGTATDRTVTVQPIAGVTGVTTIVLEVKDPVGATATVSFVVAVGVAAPVIAQSPRDKTVVEGGSALFTVGVSGTPPLSYQWMRDGVDLPGATGDSLSLATVAVSDAGAYAVRVSNAAGSVPSQSAVLTVTVPAQVSAAGQDLVISVGQPLNLTVNASGTPPLTYQWYRNGILIDGATAPSFSVASAQLGDSGKYTVIINNIVGPISGPVFNVTAIDPVVIVSHPQSLQAKQGDEVRLSVGVSGTGPFKYVWELNGAAFRETSKPELILPGVQVNAAGNYRVRVSNGVSEAVSTDAALTVIGQAKLTGLPKILRVAIGSDLVLHVVAEGTAPYIYQWQLNGENIVGATTDTYRIPNIQSPDGGTYSVTVTDGGGATTSDLTNVIVITPDLGLADNVGGASPTSAPSGDGSGHNVGASAEPGEPSHGGGRPAKRSVWMAWNSPGTGIASFGTRGSGFDTILAVYKGAPGSLIQVASDEDSGGFLTSATSFNTEAGVLYYVAVDGFEGAQGAIGLRWSWTQTSEPQPVIATEPQSRTVLLGQTATFSVVAQSPSGSPLSYQWFLDGVAIGGANSATFTVPSAGGGDVGDYRVDVTNPGGTVRSSVAILQINLIATGSEGAGVRAIDKVGSSSQTGQQIVVGPASAGIPDSSGIAKRSVRPVTLQSTLQGTRGEKLFSTKSAVKDAGEPNHCRVPGGASTWFIYQPSQSGALRVSTEGSSYDTVLAAYVSPTVDVDYGKLVEVKCDNNSGADGKTSVMEFAVEAGTRYYLVVDGVDGTTGLVHFSYELIQLPAVSKPTWFAVNPANGQVDPSVENPAAGVGAEVEFQVGVGGLPSQASVGYQWRRNGIDLAAGTNATVRISGLSQTDAGDYTVEVTTFAGSVASQSARFAVSEPIQLLYQPQDETLVTGQSAYFAVGPFGAGPFSFQWSFGGQDLPGMTNSVLQVVNVQPADAGVYGVAVSDGTSQTQVGATLTVQEALRIVIEPQGLELQAGRTLELSVSAQGVAPLSYQWRYDGVDIAGATGETLTLPAIRTAQAGRYTVVVSNAFSTLQSQEAVVSVVPVSSQIESFERLADGTVELRMTGPVGARAVVLVSSDMLEWTELVNLPIVNASFTYIDTEAPNIAVRFYRGQVLP